MIYVFEGGSIVYDGNSISAEQKTQAVAVESLPSKETPEGHLAQIHADKASETVWWEYVLIPEPEPEPEPEVLPTVEDRVADLEQAVDSMLGGGPVE